MSAARLPDWRQRAAAFIMERRFTPEVWGESDCALTAADMVKAMTGVDYAAPLRGYSTPFGALKALVKLGHYSISEYLDTILPRALRPMCGDFVVEPDDPFDRVGIADGWGRCWTQDKNGIVRRTLARRFMAWRV